MVVALVVFIIGIGFVWFAASKRSAAVSRTLDLREFGVSLEIPGTLHALTYVARDESTKGPGTVLHMYAGDQCDLAAIYEIQKNAIARSHTTWTEKTLQQFEAPQGAKPAQVKEFTDFYLVIEPNPNLCATDAAGKKTEQQQQLDLWNALISAHYMQ